MKHHHSFVRKTEATIRRYGMVESGESILVALSGGPDSVALTHALVELRTHLSIEIGVAHLNHGLRSEASDDEAFCKGKSLELDLPFYSTRADVSMEARNHRRSVEEQARESRYSFLEGVAEREGYGRIALGHTMDDQAETLLFRLFRGSGARGLASIRPSMGRRIRPLIEHRSSEVRNFLEKLQIKWCNDISNLDTEFTRNRLRLETLPKLEGSYNPRLTETLARTARILNQENDFLEQQVVAAYRKVTSPSLNGIDLRIDALTQLHPALVRRVVRRAIEEVRGSLHNVGAVHVDDVLRLSQSAGSGHEIHLPGIVVARSFNILRVSPRNYSKHGYNGYEYLLRFPTHLTLLEMNGTLTASSTISYEDFHGWTRPAAGNSVLIGISDEIEELTVRSPRQGDRFHPLGAPGTKALSRYLMERKVAKADRKRVPLIVQKDGAILWVAGHAVAEAARLTPGGRGLLLEWKTRLRADDT